MSYMLKFLNFSPLSQNEFSLLRCFNFLLFLIIQLLKSLLLPLHVTNLLEDEHYDAYVIVSSDLEKDFTKHNLMEKFDELKSLKKVYFV